MTVDQKEISDFLLERYLLNELPSQKQEALAKIINDNPSYQEKLKNIKEDNQLFLQKHSPSSQMEIIKSQAKARKNQNRKTINKQSIFKGVSALAGMLLIFFLIRPVLKNSIHPSINGTERLKGLQSELRVYRKSGNQIEILKNNSTAKEGDLLQLSYIAAGKKYGVIFSIDGRKSFTLHYPTAGTKNQKLQQKKQILLAHSYELDDAPQFERFFFITSKAPINLDKLKNRVELWLKNESNLENTKLTLPENLKQHSITIKKEQ